MGLYAPGLLHGVRGLQKEALVHAGRGAGLRALLSAQAEQAGGAAEAGEAGIVVGYDTRNDGCDPNAVRELSLGRLLCSAAAPSPSPKERGAFGYLLLAVLCELPWGPSVAAAGVPGEGT